jgi:hypothetical protein
MRGCIAGFAALLGAVPLVPAAAGWPHPFWCHEARPTADSRSTPHRRSGGQPAQGGAEQRGDFRRRSHVGAHAHLGESFPRLLLPETELPQGSEGLGPGLDAPSRHDLAVGSSVGVPEGESARHAAIDPQAAVMRPVMMSAAEHDQPLRIVVASLTLEIDVVDVDEHGLRAARYGAAPAVAEHHRAADGRRDGLARPCRLGLLGCCRSHVGGLPELDPLRIAGGGGNRLRLERGPLPVALLPAAAAVLADADHELLARSAGIARTHEDLARHQQQQSIIVEARVRLATQLRDRLAEGRQSGGADLEAKHVAAVLVEAWI